MEDNTKTDLEERGWEGVGYKPMADTFERGNKSSGFQKNVGNF
jgi:hypothetical protein